MAKKSEQTDTTNAAASTPPTPVERVMRARDDYFRELYDAWQSTAKEMTDGNRAYQERIAALSSSDEIVQAQTAVREANRSWATAVHAASSVPTADARDAVVAERDKYSAAVEALNGVTGRVQQTAQEQHQDFASQSSSALAGLHERYAAAFLHFTGAIVDALAAAGDPVEPALAYALGQQLIAVSSHAAWLQRTSPTVRRQAAAAA